MANEEKIGALWHQDNGRNEWLSGIVGGKRIICFRNKYKKKGDKQPDWNVFPQKPKDELPPKEEDDEVPF